LYARLLSFLRRLYHRCSMLIEGQRSGLPLILVQEVHSHPGMSVDVNRFYSTWFRPDDRTRTCCNTVDCYPTKVMFKDGQWWAFRREDDKYIPVPWEKVERNRDSPDGRSHLRDSSASPLPGHHLLQIWQVGGGPSAPAHDARRAERDRGDYRNGGWASTYSFPAWMSAD
jgi:hypothetical protein